MTTDTVAGLVGPPWPLIDDVPEVGDYVVVRHACGWFDALVIRARSVAS